MGINVWYAGPLCARHAYTVDLRGRHYKRPTSKLCVARARKTFAPRANRSPHNHRNDSAHFLQRNDILYNNNASATAHESLTFPPGELVVNGVKSRGGHLAQDFLSDVDFEMTVNSAANLLRQANQRAGQMMPKWHGADLANAVGQISYLPGDNLLHVSSNLRRTIQNRFKRSQAPSQYFAWLRASAVEEWVPGARLSDPINWPGLVS